MNSQPKDEAANRFLIRKFGKKDTFEELKGSGNNEDLTDQKISEQKFDDTYYDKKNELDQKCWQLYCKFLEDKKN